MTTTNNGRRALQMVTAVALVAVLSATACNPPKENPFILGERGIPTPVPTSVSTPALTDLTRYKYNERASFGTIKFGNWEDSGINLVNMLAGYIMVHGFGYSVELVETDEHRFKSELLNGDLDVVMEVAADWVDQYSESGEIMDLGTLFESESGIRIGVHPYMRDKAPDLVEFLSKMVPGDERLADLESRIAGGRLGIRANVAALIYLKRHRDVWTGWVPPLVVDNVETAVKEGKTSLKTRRCIPDGGNQNCR